MDKESQKNTQSILKEQLLSGTISGKDFVLRVMDLDQETDAALGNRIHAEANAQLLNEPAVQNFFKQHPEFNEFWDELQKIIYDHAPIHYTGDPREISYQMSAMYENLEGAPDEVVKDHYDTRNMTFAISINAPVRVVFDCIVSKETYPKWASVWGEGMTFEGEWKEGGYISFVDASGEGTKALIEEFQMHYNTASPESEKGIEYISNAYIAMRHTAMVKGDREVESLDDTMKKWIGTRESYNMTEEEDVTELRIHIQTNVAFEPMMQKWDEALKLLKDICEN